MIEMVARMIAAILGLIKKGELKAAEDRLDDIYYNVLREDAGFFRNIPEDKLTITLLEQHDYTNGHLEILAELFNVEAELCLAKGNKPGSLEYSKKSLKLFDYIEEKQKTYSFDRINKINSIRVRIENLNEKS